MMRPFQIVGCALAVLLASCSSKNPTGLSPEFREAILEAQRAVHEDFEAQATGSGATGFDQAVANARSAMRRAQGRIHNSSDENAFLVLLNCFSKDRQRYQIMLLERQGLASGSSQAEIMLLNNDHEQCVKEFRRWTAADSSEARTGEGNSCLLEASKAKEFLERMRD